MRLIRRMATIAAIAVAGYAQTPSAPTFLEFSRFFQLGGPVSDNTPVRIANGPAGDFYVAGVVYATYDGLVNFPIPPVNRMPPPEFMPTGFGFVARFGSAGDLISWQLLWSFDSEDALTPRFLRISPAGDVVVVITGSELGAPATSGAFRDSTGSVSMLVLSADLATVRASTFLAPPGSTFDDAALDDSGNLVWSGSVPGDFVPEGDDLTTAPLLARISSDGRQLLQIQSLASAALGSTSAQKIALASDGGIWLGSSTNTPGLPVTGLLRRGIAGSNAAIWSPRESTWKPALVTELGADARIYGHPLRSEFLAAGSQGIFTSTDGGSSWTVRSPQPSQGLAWCPSDPTRVYSWIGSKLSSSTDSGATWSAVTLPEGVAEIGLLTVAPDDPQTIALHSGRSTYLSANGGADWQTIPDPPSVAPARLAILTDADHPLLMICADLSTYQFSSGSWNGFMPAQPEAIFGQINFESGILSYKPAMGDLAYSPDLGSTWIELPLCDDGDNSCRLWINPGMFNEWWVTGKQAWRSVDSGDTWTLVASDLSAGTVVSLAFAGTDENTAVASLALNRDVYLRKLGPTWEDLQFAGYWGGSGSENLAGLIADASGSLTVISNTDSADYPITANALQAQIAGAQGAAISQFTTSFEAPEFSSFWGGSRFDHVSRVMQDSVGRIFWCGSSQSNDLPSIAEAPVRKEGDPQPTWAMVAGFDPASRGWLPAHVFGGDKSSSAGDCASTPEGKIAVTGVTTSTDFPIAGPSMPMQGAGPRAFVSAIRP